MKICDCRWDVKLNKRIYCNFHTMKRQTKQPKRPILYASSPQALYQAGMTIKDPLARAEFFFVYLTAGRINEVTDFSVNRMSIRDGFLHVRMKTLKQRSRANEMRNLTIPIMKQALCLENKMWAEVSPLFSDGDSFSKPFRKWKNMSEYLARALDITIEAKVLNRATGEWSDRIITKKCRPHYLRHCRNTHLVEYYDFSTVELCNFNGWQNPKMALIYTKFRDLLSAFRKKLPAEA